MLGRVPDGGKCPERGLWRISRAFCSDRATRDGSPTPSLLCVGCWQNLHVPVALRGIASIPFRLVGLRPSRMNPNTCTFCEIVFTKVMRARNVTIEARLLFADLRGYTDLTRRPAAGIMAALLDTFYDACGDAIWDHDGIAEQNDRRRRDGDLQFPDPARRSRANRPSMAARDLQASCQEVHRFRGHAWPDAGTRRRHRHRLRQRGVRGVRPYPSRPDGDRHGRQPRGARPGRRCARPNPGDQEVHDRAPTLSWPGPATDYQLKGFDSPISLYAA